MHSSVNIEDFLFQAAWIGIGTLLAIWLLSLQGFALQFWIYHLKPVQGSLQVSPSF